MFVSLIWVFSFLDLPNPQPPTFFFHISVTSKFPCRGCYSSRHLVAFFHESLFSSILKPNQHISIIYKIVCAGCRYKASAERRLCLNDLFHHYIPSSGEASSLSWASQTLSRYLQPGQQPLQKICGTRTAWFSEDDVATGGSVSWLSAAPPSWVVGCERGCYPPAIQHTTHYRPEALGTPCMLPELQPLSLPPIEQKTHVLLYTLLTFSLPYD